MALIKSISGIRGNIGGRQGENLTPQDIALFTAAYAQWLKRATKRSNKRLSVVVGRDARPSGEMVERIVHATLMGCGIDVIDVGLASTPSVELGVEWSGADGGVIITASHNPKDWNALKLLDSNGEFLSAKEGDIVLKLAESGEIEYAPVDSLGVLIDGGSLDKRHIEAVLALPLVDVEAVRSMGYKVVVDGINSVGGVIIPALLKGMGVEVVELNCEPNGQFGHNPEPLPENLTEIAAAVVAHGADLGVVVDPDVDRLALVCETGDMFGEEYTLVAVADYILSHTPGDTVSNLSSSRALKDVTEARGGKHHSSAVGEVNVVEMIKRVGAVIGGEGNGGVIYPELHCGRDALVGVALFLTHLAKSGKSASQLRAEYPSYYISKNRVVLRPQVDVELILSRVKESYSHEQINDLDGIRIDFLESKEWVHLRRSNTEPIIRIYSESRERESAERLAQLIISEIEQSSDSEGCEF